MAGVWPLDPPTVARLGAAIVRERRAAHPLSIVVGRDTRESGEWIERELARGAASAGATVTSIGVAPTPAVAYLAGARDFDLGVVLSASHNPFGDNGIKVFSGHGEKFGESDERAVEQMMADTSWSVTTRAGAPVDAPELLDEYIDHVQRLLPHARALSGGRIAVDLANGATTTTAVRVLKAAGFEVLPIGHEPDGRNINLGCGSTHPARLAGVVVEHKCRLGVAFDGCGSRQTSAPTLLCRQMRGKAIAEPPAPAPHRESLARSPEKNSEPCRTTQLAADHKEGPRFGTSPASARTFR